MKFDDYRMLRPKPFRLQIPVSALLLPANPRRVRLFIGSLGLDHAILTFGDVSSTKGGLFVVQQQPGTLIRIEDFGGDLIQQITVSASDVNGTLVLGYEISEP